MTSDDCVTREEFNELKESLNLNSAKVRSGYQTSLKKMATQSDGYYNVSVILYLFSILMIIAAIVGLGEGAYVTAAFSGFVSMLSLVTGVGCTVQRRYWDAKYTIFREFNKGEE